MPEQVVCHSRQSVFPSFTLWNRRIGELGCTYPTPELLPSRGEKVLILNKNRCLTEFLCSLYFKFYPSFEQKSYAKSDTEALVASRLIPECTPNDMPADVPPVTYVSR